MTASKNELQALSTVKTFNDLARRAADKGAETLSLIWKAGETAKEAKANIPHGEWMTFVEQHYDVTHRSVNRWVKFHETVSESKLDMVSNLDAGLTMIEKPKTTQTTTKNGGPGKAGSSDESSRGGHSDADRNRPAAYESGEDDSTEAPWEEPQETGSRRRGSAKAKPVADFGKCPNCAGSKWLEDADGAFCEKCHHPHGEPAGDVDEDRIKTQRQKTVKTIEALMRAFDDLQLLASNNTKHAGAIAKCKALLPFAKEWK